MPEHELCAVDPVFRRVRLGGRRSERQQPEPKRIRWDNERGGLRKEPSVRSPLVGDDGVRTDVVAMEVDDQRDTLGAACIHRLHSDRTELRKGDVGARPSKGGAVLRGVPGREHVSPYRAQENAPAESPTSRRPGRPHEGDVVEKERPVGGPVDD